MYKKITSEEFDELKIKGWGRSSPFYNELIALKPGEGLVVLKSQWRRSKPPSNVCRYIEKKFRERKMKYKCVALADNTGWAIKRVA